MSVCVLTLEAHLKVLRSEAGFLVEEARRIVGFNVQCDVAIGPVKGGLKKLFANALTSRAAVGGDVHKNVFGNVPFHPRGIDDGGSCKAFFIVGSYGESAETLSVLHGVIEAGADLIGRVSVLIKLIKKKGDKFRSLLR